MQFAIRVKAGAKRDAARGTWNGALGVALIVAVRAPAVDGKANAAVRRVLAQALDVPARDLDIVRGVRGQDKIISIDPAPAGVQRRLDSLY